MVYKVLSFILFITLSFSCGKMPSDKGSGESKNSDVVHNIEEDVDITEEINYEAYACRKESSCSTCFTTQSHCKNSCSSKSGSARSACTYQCELNRSHCTSNYCNPVCEDSFTGEKQITDCKNYCRIN